VNRGHWTSLQAFLLVLSLVFLPGLALAGLPWRAEIGVELGIGSVVNRLGVTVKGYCGFNDLQANARIAGYYGLSGYGPPVPRPEFQAAVGVTLGFGRKSSDPDPFLSPVGNQTGRMNSVGYSYMLYLDTVRTSQLSGQVSLQFDKFQFLTENDALAFLAFDRFRTGAFMFAWRDGDAKAGVKAMLWTGNPRGAKRIQDPGYPSRFGYKDLSENLYGRFSSGMLAVFFQKKIPFFSDAVVEAGIDAEQVRNIFQNGFHDLISFPAAWNRSKTPHYPMLDTDGRPFLNLPGQKIRPARFFFFCGLDSPAFY